MKDTYKHKGLRKQLLEEIKRKGIVDQRVLDAIGKVPRHHFFDSAFISHAYEDKAFPIAANQTISQPFTVAYQTESLQIVPENKVLEIGTGSGYQTIVLLELGAVVYTIEYQRELYEKAKKLLPSMGYDPYMFLGDGSTGLKVYAPYDAIIVTAGAPSVPESLIRQLKIGGRMIIPIGDRSVQKMLLLKKKDEKTILKKELQDFCFVPLLGEEGWN